MKKTVESQGQSKVTSSKSANHRGSLRPKPSGNTKIFENSGNFCKQYQLSTFSRLLEVKKSLKNLDYDYKDLLVRNWNGNIRRQQYDLLLYWRNLWLKWCRLSCQISETYVKNTTGSERAPPLKKIINNLEVSIIQAYAAAERTSADAWVFFYGIFNKEKLL